MSFEQLEQYPCLVFDQGDEATSYLSEEILADVERSRVIRATDRATMLNLMKGLNGYTLCSGIICEELNGTDYLAIPYKATDKYPNDTMEIGYILKNGFQLDEIGRNFVQEIKRYLNTYSRQS